MKTIKKTITHSLCILLALVLVECKEKQCIQYKYKIDVCNNCFGAWFYTNSIRWEHGMLVAVDEEGNKRTVKPLEVHEGIFKDCKPKSQIPTKKYIVQTTHDNNWTTSSRIECDSVTMVSQNEVVLWIDGREMKMVAPMFKIFEAKQ